jgi:hypothetical protein
VAPALHGPVETIQPECGEGHTCDACETDAEKLEALVPETPRPCSPGRANRAEGGIARDITERREVEAAHQERDIVRSLP